MDARQERGLVIAATCRLKRDADGSWIVPSQSHAEMVYRVNLETKSCTCPDCTESGFICKHYYAATIVHKRDVLPDGSVIETKSVTFTEKKTYTQNWAAYNEAQITEKHRFLELLRDLCSGIPDLPQPKTGRKHDPLSDRVFACVYKVYSGVSSRRFGSDLKDAHVKGYLAKPMHSVCVCAHLENPTTTPALQQLVVQSSLPLRSIETTFAPDSTGFSTSRFVRWFDEKYGVTRSGRDWVKAHAMVGTRTNIVTAIEIQERSAADCPQFGPLMEATASNFNVQEVVADKAYLSFDNLAMVDRLGAVPYIPFKSNSTQGEAGSLWEKMFLYYNFRREEFLRHYHQRSNVESTFSAIKRKFGDSVRSKNDVAMKNEVLCKVICNNICCVILSQIELGIEPVFWDDRPAEEAILPMVKLQ